ncbi:MAG TPA: S24 family peptidase [Candidatus Paceibacterota bacterium]|nr:S24 family peptidase [Candidatus Paceibacterota bacterium]
MHEIQQKLLALTKDKNLGKYTLREIGAFIGEKSPQKIKHHLQQLEKRGLITINKMKGTIEKTKQGFANGALDGAKLLRIPIVGAANAGPAQIFAETNIEGYLRASTSLIDRRYSRSANRASTEGLFAIRVSGPSMNRAEIGGKRIEDGDYVIIDSHDQSAINGDIVLSLIDGMANIKKYYIDKENNQILLMSESTHDFPAIHIHEDDDFSVNGKVIGVIKTPKAKRRF